MAMVDAMPVPDSRQKVDELFLFWLSEPSTQEMLRNELTKVCRYGNDGVSGGGESPSILDSLVGPSAVTTSVPRSSSPNNSNYRTPSPPLHLSNSPKSPRAKRRAKSPRRSLKYGASSSAATEKTGPSTAFDDTDYFPTPSTSEPDARKTEKAGAPGRADTSAILKDTEQQKARRARSAKSAKLTRSEVIPRFFFPNGRAGEAREESIDGQLQAAANVFQEQPNGEVTMADFHLIVKAMGLPLYWKATLFRACQYGDPTPTDTAATVSLPGLRKTWQRLVLERDREGG
jgi:serine/threonine-protein phosphatase 2A regulatory subunit B''